MKNETVIVKIQMPVPLQVMTNIIEALTEYYDECEPDKKVIISDQTSDLEFVISTIPNDEQSHTRNARTIGDAVSDGSREQPSSDEG